MRISFCRIIFPYRTMKRFLLLFVCLGASLVALAAETTIQGSVAGFNGRMLKVYAISDYITQSKIEIAKTEIENNAFKLSFPLSSTQQVFLKIEDKQTSLFAKAGGVYNISLNYDTEANQGKAFDKYLDLRFSFPRANEINQSIKKFNQSYQEFFAENYKAFILKAAKKEIDEFVLEWQKQLESEKDEFVYNYINYALANLEDINSASKDRLYEDYLNNKEILYLNKEYMNFFTQLYHLNFEQFVLTKNGSEVMKALMLEEDLSKTLSLIKKYRAIHNDALAELYLIYGLMEVYHKKTINQEVSFSILEQISKRGKTEQNKLIALNVISSLKGLNALGRAPDFTLKNEKNEDISLSDFKGKHIYLGFWADWSIPSLRELKVINNLVEKYGDKIHFVSINLDDGTDKMKKVKAENNYKWTFLSFENDFEIKEKYRIKTVPTYFLIDENGVMIDAPAVGPTEIERTLYELVK